MIGIEWARASQFNWVYDAMGGTPLQQTVSGLWDGISFTVNNNQVVIPANLGGGRVYWLRGVWTTDALFAWGGFWVDPETQNPNYYTGGSYQNNGNETIIYLGTGLPNGTAVQVYYLYNTGVLAAKYDSLNSTPCMRQALRSDSDYTYDFAVDRIFDVMAAVYFAYKEQDRDPGTILAFFWKAYFANAASNGNPLIFDNFNRGFYDKGSYLIYANSSQGWYGFEQFGNQLPPDDLSLGRALRFKPAYYQGSWFSAWCGYGFNWDLTPQYFNTISQVKFKLRGAGVVTRVQKCIKTAGSGSANIILIDEFDGSGAAYYLLAVTVGGASGSAQASLKRYGPDLVLESDTTIACPGEGGYVNLGNGLKAYWEDGTLAVGDTWYLTCGSQEIKPLKLHVNVNDSIPTDADPWGEAHTFVHGLGDYYATFKSFEIDFSQFWRLGNIIDCRDRKPGHWGSWSSHAGETGAPYELLYYDVEAEEVINGETFYTKQKFTWNLSPTTLLALGFYVGVPWDVSSVGKANVNYLIKNNSDQSIGFRTKVRDAGGHYFYHDDMISADTWVRVTIPFGSFLPENSGDLLTHPLSLVDIGIPDLVHTPGHIPAQGDFEVVDLKFDDHLTFAGSEHLRVVEFKYQETSLKLAEGPDWYFDDFGFGLAVEDPYPYVPRLAISLNAYGRNPWRGPTLVHYSHPLAPFLVDRLDVRNTELQLHADAQTEFNNRYGGVKGPVVPVHTRNDVENIALCGEANFNKFCWWPDYPETRHALGQLWAFDRLAEYYFVSSDASAWGVLDHWLTWLSTYVVPDGAGWKFPLWFGEEHSGGFSYDTNSYDPGAAASIVVGCLYVYLRNGDARALGLVQKILADLRLHRASGQYGGYLYKSDYHYAWMNALVAHAFGLAVVGRAGAAYNFPFTADDRQHFLNMMNNFWAMSGDSKPNLLNADLIPFHDCEPHDIWDYAPNYMFMKEMGSMEGVVLMLHTAIDWALYSGSYAWFNTLLEFIIRIGEGVLQENQIYSVRSNFATSQGLTRVALTYGNYRSDNSLYQEAVDQDMVNRLGEIKSLVPMHYGSPVITEDANTAALICNRTLEYFAAPKETVQVVADLSAARFNLNDFALINSPFHGYDNAKFAIIRRLYDKKKLRVVLDLMRNVNYAPS